MLFVMNFFHSILSLIADEYLNILYSNAAFSIHSLSTVTISNIHKLHEHPTYADLFNSRYRLILLFYWLLCWKNWIGVDRSSLIINKILKGIANYILSITVYVRNINTFKEICTFVLAVVGQNVQQHKIN